MFSKKEEKYFVEVYSAVNRNGIQILVCCSYCIGVESMLWNVIGYYTTATYPQPTETAPKSGQKFLRHNTHFWGFAGSKIFMNKSPTWLLMLKTAKKSMKLKDDFLKPIISLKYSLFYSNIMEMIHNIGEWLHVLW